MNLAGDQLQASRTQGALNRIELVEYLFTRSTFFGHFDHCVQMTCGTL